MASKKPLVTFRPTVKEDLECYKEWLMQPGVLEGFPMSDKREIDDAVRLWHQYLAKGASITALRNLRDGAHRHLTNLGRAM